MNDQPTLDSPHPVSSSDLGTLEAWLDGAWLGGLTTVAAVLAATGVVVAVATPTMGATRSTALRREERRRETAAAVPPARPPKSGAPLRSSDLRDDHP